MAPADMIFGILDVDQDLLRGRRGADGCW